MHHVLVVSSESDLTGGGPAARAVGHHDQDVVVSSHGIQESSPECNRMYKKS